MGRTAFLFPGQGSQAVGMCRDLYDAFSSVRDVFDKAESVTGLKLRELCFDGPMEALTETMNLQPALTAVNLACIAALREKSQVRADICAGHSLGEYAALYYAGVISFEDTFKLVLSRGRLMQREADLNPGKMSAVLRLKIDTVQQIVDKLKEQGVIAVANHNSEKQIVITGEPDLIKQASKLVRENKGISVPLNVSGAWHSDLIGNAQAEFCKILESIPFQEPEIPVLFNVTAEEQKNPKKIRKLMGRQFCMPVKWHDIMLAMIHKGVDTFVEIGPGTVLTGLILKTSSENMKPKTYNVNSLESLSLF